MELLMKLRWTLYTFTSNGNPSFDLKYHSQRYGNTTLIMLTVRKTIYKWIPVKKPAGLICGEKDRIVLGEDYG